MFHCPGPILFHVAGDLLRGRYPQGEVGGLSLHPDHLGSVSRLRNRLCVWHTISVSWSGQLISKRCLDTSVMGMIKDVDGSWACHSFFSASVLHCANEKSKHHSSRQSAAWKRGFLSLHASSVQEIALWSESVGSVLLTYLPPMRVLGMIKRLEIGNGDFLFAFLLSF